MSADITSAVKTDQEIVRLFFERDENAIMKVEKAYGNLFRSIARNITGSAEDAMECVNDAYLRMWNSIPPETPQSVKAYGGRITRNLAINRAEYNSAARRGGSEILLELDESVTASETDFSEGEISRAIDSFLRSEDRENRVPFVLRYWYCMPLADIAKRTGCTVQTVKSRLFRTRKKLKEYLEKEGISL